MFTGLHGWGPPEVVQFFQEKSIVAFILLSKWRNAALDCLQVDGLLVPEEIPVPSGTLVAFDKYLLDLIKLNFLFHF